MVVLIIPEISGATRKYFRIRLDLREKQRMEFVHKSIIERGEILEAIGAGFFEALEEKYLGTGVQLLQQLTELGHRITSGRYAQHIVDQPFDELLCDILATEQSLGYF